MPAKQFTIKVLTGDADGAGTDSSVRIKLLGPQGQNSEFIKLDTNDNNFERLSYDRFPVPVNSPPSKILGVQLVLGEDAGWLIDTVIVHENGSTNYWLFTSDKPQWYKHNSGKGTILYATPALNYTEEELKSAQAN